MSRERNATSRRAEALLWSIALPGLGQFLNRKYLKGVVIVGIGLLLNLQSNFSIAVLLSVRGNIGQAIAQTDYQWLLFYPCLYMFSIWDTYKDAGGGGSTYSFLPFVVSAYSTTVGLMYSPSLTIFGKLWGPVWLPVLGGSVGFCAGVLLKRFLPAK